MASEAEIPERILSNKIPEKGDESICGESESAKQMPKVGGGGGICEGGSFLVSPSLAKVAIDDTCVDSGSTAADEKLVLQQKEVPDNETQSSKDLKQEDVQEAYSIPGEEEAPLNVDEANETPKKKAILGHEVESIDGQASTTELPFNIEEVNAANHSEEDKIEKKISNNENEFEQEENIHETSKRTTEQNQNALPVTPGLIAEISSNTEGKEAGPTIVNQGETENTQEGHENPQDNNMDCILKGKESSMMQDGEIKNNCEGINVSFHSLPTEFITEKTTLDKFEQESGKIEQSSIESIEKRKETDDSFETSKDKSSGENENLEDHQEIPLVIEEKRLDKSEHEAGKQEQTSSSELEDKSQETIDSNKNMEDENSVEYEIPDAETQKIPLVSHVTEGLHFQEQDKPYKIEDTSETESANTGKGNCNQPKLQEASLETDESTICEEAKDEENPETTLDPYPTKDDGVVKKGSEKLVFPSTNASIDEYKDKEGPSVTETESNTEVTERIEDEEIRRRQIPKEIKASEQSLQTDTDDEKFEKSLVVVSDVVDVAASSADAEGSICEKEEKPIDSAEARFKEEIKEGNINSENLTAVEPSQKLEKMEGESPNMEIGNSPVIHSLVEESKQQESEQQEEVSNLEVEEQVNEYQNVPKEIEASDQSLQTNKTDEEKAEKSLDVVSDAVDVATSSADAEGSICEKEEKPINSAEARFKEEIKEENINSENLTAVEPSLKLEKMEGESPNMEIGNSPVIHSLVEESKQQECEQQEEVSNLEVEEQVNEDQNVPKEIEASEQSLQTDKTDKEKFEKPLDVVSDAVNADAEGSIGEKEENSTDSAEATFKEEIKEGNINSENLTAVEPSQKLEKMEGESPNMEIGNATVIHSLVEESKQQESEQQEEVSNLEVEEQVNENQNVPKEIEASEQSLQTDKTDKEKFEKSLDVVFDAVNAAASSADAEGSIGEKEENSTNSAEATFKEDIKEGNINSENLTAVEPSQIHQKLEKMEGESSNMEIGNSPVIHSLVEESKQQECKQQEEVSNLEVQEQVNEVQNVPKEIQASEQSLQTDKTDEEKVEKSLDVVADAVDAAASSADAEGTIGEKEESSTNSAEATFKEEIKEGNMNSENLTAAEPAQKIEKMGGENPNMETGNSPVIYSLLEGSKQQECEQQEEASNIEVEVQVNEDKKVPKEIEAAEQSLQTDKTDEEKAEKSSDVVSDAVDADASSADAEGSICEKEESPINSAEASFKEEIKEGNINSENLTAVEPSQMLEKMEGESSYMEVGNSPVIHSLVEESKQEECEQQEEVSNLEAEEQVNEDQNVPKEIQASEQSLQTDKTDEEKFEKSFNVVSDAVDAAASSADAEGSISEKEEKPINNAEASFKEEIKEANINSVNLTAAEPAQKLEKMGGENPNMEIGNSPVIHSLVEESKQQECEQQEEVTNREVEVPVHEDKNVPKEIEASEQSLQTDKTDKEKFEKSLDVVSDAVSAAASSADAEGSIGEKEESSTNSAEATFKEEIKEGNINSENLTAVEPSQKLEKLEGESPNMEIGNSPIIHSLVEESQQQECEQQKEVSNPEVEEQVNEDQNVPAEKNHTEEAFRVKENIESTILEQEKSREGAQTLELIPQASEIQVEETVKVTEIESKGTSRETDASLGIEEQTENNEESSEIGIDNTITEGEAEKMINEDCCISDQGTAFFEIQADDKNAQVEAKEADLEFSVEEPSCITDYTDKATINEIINKEVSAEANITDVGDDTEKHIIEESIITDESTESIKEPLEKRIQEDEIMKQHEEEVRLVPHTECEVLEKSSASESTERQTVAENSTVEDHSTLPIQEETVTESSQEDEVPERLETTGIGQETEKSILDYDAVTDTSMLSVEGMKVKQNPEEDEKDEEKARKEFTSSAAENLENVEDTEKNVDASGVTEASTEEILQKEHSEQFIMYEEHSKEDIEKTEKNNGQLETESPRALQESKQDGKQLVDGSNLAPEYSLVTTETSSTSFQCVDVKGVKHEENHKNDCSGKAFKVEKQEENEGNQEKERELQSRSSETVIGDQYKGIEATNGIEITASEAPVDKRWEETLEGSPTLASKEELDSTEKSETKDQSPMLKNNLEFSYLPDSEGKIPNPKEEPQHPEDIPKLDTNEIGKESTNEEIQEDDSAKGKMFPEKNTSESKDADEIHHVEEANELTKLEENSRTETLQDEHELQESSEKLGSEKQFDAVSKDVQTSNSCAIIEKHVLDLEDHAEILDEIPKEAIIGGEKVENMGINLEAGDRSHERNEGFDPMENSAPQEVSAKPDITDVGDDTEKHVIEESIITDESTESMKESLEKSSQEDEITKQREEEVRLVPHTECEVLEKSSASESTERQTVAENSTVEDHSTLPIQEETVTESSQEDEVSERLETTGIGWETEKSILDYGAVTDTSVLSVEGMQVEENPEEDEKDEEKPREEFTSSAAENIENFEATEKHVNASGVTEDSTEEILQKEHSEQFLTYEEHSKEDIENTGKNNGQLETESPRTLQESNQDGKQLVASSNLASESSLVTAETISTSFQCVDLKGVKHEEKHDQNNSSEMALKVENQDASEGNQERESKLQTRSSESVIGDLYKGTEATNGTEITASEAPVDKRWEETPEGSSTLASKVELDSIEESETMDKSPKLENNLESSHLQDSEGKISIQKEEPQHLEDIPKMNIDEIGKENTNEEIQEDDSAKGIMFPEKNTSESKDADEIHDVEEESSEKLDGEKQFDAVSKDVQISNPCATIEKHVLDLEDHAEILDKIPKEATIGGEKVENMGINLEAGDQSHERNEGFDPVENRSLQEKSEDASPSQKLERLCEAVAEGQSHEMLPGAEENKIKEDNTVVEDQHTAAVDEQMIIQEIQEAEKDGIHLKDTALEFRAEAQKEKENIQNEITETTTLDEVVQTQEADIDVNIEALDLNNSECPNKEPEASPFKEVVERDIMQVAKSVPEVSYEEMIEEHILKEVESNDKLSTASFTQTTGEINSEEPEPESKKLVGASDIGSEQMTQRTAETDSMHEEVEEVKLVPTPDIVIQLPSEGENAHRDSKKLEILEPYEVEEEVGRSFHAGSESKDQDYKTITEAETMASQPATVEESEQNLQERSVPCSEQEFGNKITNQHIEDEILDKNEPLGVENSAVPFTLEGNENSCLQREEPQEPEQATEKGFQDIKKVSANEEQDEREGQKLIEASKLDSELPTFAEKGDVSFPGRERNTEPSEACNVCKIETSKEEENEIFVSNSLVEESEGKKFEIPSSTISGDHDEDGEKVNNGKDLLESPKSPKETTEEEANDFGTKEKAKQETETAPSMNKMDASKINDEAGKDLDAPSAPNTPEEATNEEGVNEPREAIQLQTEELIHGINKTNEENRGDAAEDETVVKVVIQVQKPNITSSNLASNPEDIVEDLHPTDQEVQPNDPNNSSPEASQEHSSEKGSQMTEDEGPSSGFTKQATVEVNLPNEATEGDPVKYEGAVKETPVPGQENMAVFLSDEQATADNPEKHDTATNVVMEAKLGAEDKSQELATIEDQGEKINAEKQIPDREILNDVSEELDKADASTNWEELTMGEETHKKCHEDGKVSTEVNDTKSKLDLEDHGEELDAEEDIEEKANEANRIIKCEMLHEEVSNELKEDGSGEEMESKVTEEEASKDSSVATIRDDHEGGKPGTQEVKKFHAALEEQQLETISSTNELDPTIIKNEADEDLGVSPIPDSPAEEPQEDEAITEPEEVNLLVPKELVHESNEEDKEGAAEGKNVLKEHDEVQNPNNTSNSVSNAGDTVEDLHLKDQQVPTNDSNASSFTKVVQEQVPEQEGHKTGDEEMHNLVTLKQGTGEMNLPTDEIEGNSINDEAQSRDILYKEGEKMTDHSSVQETICRYEGGETPVQDKEDAVVFSTAEQGTTEEHIKESPTDHNTTSNLMIEEQKRVDEIEIELEAKDKSQASDAMEDQIEQTIDTDKPKCEILSEEEPKGLEKTGTTENMEEKNTMKDPFEVSIGEETCKENHHEDTKEGNIVNDRELKPYLEDPSREESAGEDLGEKETNKITESETLNDKASLGTANAGSSEKIEKPYIEGEVIEDISPDAIGEETTKEILQEEEKGVPAIEKESTFLDPKDQNNKTSSQNYATGKHILNEEELETTSAGNIMTIKEDLDISSTPNTPDEEAQKGEAVNQLHQPTKLIHESMITKEENSGSSTEDKCVSEEFTTVGKTTSSDLVPSPSDTVEDLHHQEVPPDKSNISSLTEVLQAKTPEQESHMTEDEGNSWVLVEQETGERSPEAEDMEQHPINNEAPGEKNLKEEPKEMNGAEAYIENREAETLILKQQERTIFSSTEQTITESSIRDSPEVLDTTGNTFFEEQSHVKTSLMHEIQKTKGKNLVDAATLNKKISSSDVQPTDEELPQKMGSVLLPEVTDEVQDHRPGEALGTESKEKGVEYSGEIIMEDVKPMHKKSHNILSGVGSKVMHSIKKVIACSSPPPEAAFTKLRK